jgi:hypothetical protein
MCAALRSVLVGFQQLPTAEIVARGICHRVSPGSWFDLCRLPPTSRGERKVPSASVAPLPLMITALSEQGDASAPVGHNHCVMRLHIGHCCCKCVHASAHVRNQAQPSCGSSSARVYTWFKMHQLVASRRCMCMCMCMCMCSVLCAHSPRIQIKRFWSSLLYLACFCL